MTNPLKDKMDDAPEIAVILVAMPIFGILIGLITERVALRGLDAKTLGINAFWNLTVRTFTAMLVVHFLVVNNPNTLFLPLQAEASFTNFPLQLLHIFFPTRFSSAGEILDPLMFEVDDDSIIESERSKSMSEEDFSSAAFGMVIFILRLVSICIGISVGSAFQPIGLTGGIACGKSTVSNALKERYSNQFNIIDVDKIAHDIVDPANMNKGDPSAYPRVVQTFGEDILVAPSSLSSKTTKNADNNTTSSPRPINRQLLGEIVFKDPIKRRQLNKITHPLITRIMLKRIFWNHFKEPQSVTVVDIPLLFESGLLQYLFGTIVIVATDKDAQLKRLKKRNPELSEGECRDRISSQMPMVTKIQMSDLVIQNNGTLNEAQTNIDKAAAKMLDKHNNWSSRVGIPLWMLIYVFLIQVMVVGEMLVRVTNYND